MSKMMVTTIGGATQDLMFYTDEAELINNKTNLLKQQLIGFEYGAKLYSDQFYLTFGGGGANAAVNFASLGLKTQTILAIGSDTTGQAILNNLKARKVNTSLIQIVKAKNSGVSAIVNVGSFNEHVIFAYRGANNCLDLSEKFVKKINSSWVYLTSLQASSGHRIEALFKHCEQKKISIFWNPGHDQLKLGLKKLAKFIKNTAVFDLNRDEALELLVGLNQGQVKNNINFILKSLHAWGQKLTVVTDGPRGAYVYDGKKVYFRAALKKKGINTTGAGDAFGSAFTAGLIKYNWDIEKALKLGILNSNAVIMKVGAQVGVLQEKDLKKYNL